MQWYSAMQGTGVSIESCWRSLSKVAKKILWNLKLQIKLKTVQLVDSTVYLWSQSAQSIQSIYSQNVP